MPGFADPNAPNLKEDNYIFLPYISNPTGNSMVRLEFTFSHVASCPTYSHASPVQCKNSITMALVSTTPTEVVAWVYIYILYIVGWYIICRFIYYTCIHSLLYIPSTSCKLCGYFSIFYSFLKWFISMVANAGLSMLFANICLDSRLWNIWLIRIWIYRFHTV